MIIASDITGLFLLPLSVTMHNYAYDIMNQMGLIFIPFIIVIVRDFFVARSLGSDNGSAAIMYIKTIEVELLKKFFVLMFFVMPVTTSNASFSHSQYSQSTFPSILSGTENVSDLNPNTNFSDLFGKGQLPLAFGLLNNLSTGFSNATLAKIPCTISSTTDACITDVSPGAIYETLKSIKPINGDSDEAVMEFANACYQPALASYFKAAESNPDEIDLLSLSFPDNSAQKYAFFSDFMNSVYLGMYDIEDYNYQPQLWITTSDSWDGTSVGSDTTIKCQVASLALYDLLLDEMKDLDNYDYISKIMTAWIDFYQRYGGDANEIVATNSLAKQEFVSAMFINAYNENNKSAMDFLDEVVNDVSNTFNDYTDDVNGRFSSFSHGLTQTYNSTFTDNLDGKNGKEYLKILGLNALHLAASGIGAGEAYTSAQIIGRIFPVLLQLTSTAVLMFSPIVILLSGYDTRVAYRISLLYLSLCFSPYVFELGQVIGNNLIAVAGDSAYTTQQFGEDSTATSTLQSVWLGYKMPMILVGMWNVLIVIVSGMRLPFSVIKAPSANVLTATEIELLTGQLLDSLGGIEVSGITPEEKEALFRGHQAGIEQELENMSEKNKSKLLQQQKRR